MKKIQIKLNLLYGSILDEFAYNIKTRTITLTLFTISEGKKTHHTLVFFDVLKYQYNENSDGNFKWETMSIAELFFIPELGKASSIAKESRLNYNFLIDGDAFEILIKAKKISLDGEMIYV